MKKKKDAGHQATKETVDESAYKFLDKCMMDGINPIEAISALAKREVIELTGERPSDTGKARVYDILRSAVRQFVEFTIRQFSSDEFTFGTLVQKIAELMKEAEDKVNSNKKNVRVIPVRIDYAFWH